ncbi:site-specific DNA-methyltransferase [Mesorhizobium sp. B2-8-9]|uniref:DNA methyltransferase n=1 Tax=Mesorhizobium sp. B2-8-9 TaxID=2589899 RepID=UPI0011260D47|nr:site-specific DNA-methyltransferase [Mesorhizobium sp. B2-8-9]TPI86385.1 site-specific DNA-methyltransferase [Mesorhizobium sp. B2-8-9]
MKAITLHEGDARAVLNGMIERGEQVDSVCSDPPYGLKSVVKRFGKENAKPAKPGRDGAFQRQSKGFMGRTWDGTDIENDPEFWHLVFQVLKPGGYIVAFSSSRTYHRMATAIEDAGFITHPMIGWCFASGFPKAHNAAVAVDKALGVKGKTVPTGDPVRRIRPGADQHKDGTWEKLDNREYQPGLYEPGTDDAAAWQGWHYGGQVRKPALEPIYVGQKPFSEKNGALNILKHGVGAVNIDGCRVPFHDDDDEAESKGKNRHADFGSGPMQNQIYGKFSKDRDNYDPPGRWPANIAHDASAEVAALFPSNAARFFESYPFDGQPILYHAKASSKDRINKCTSCGTRFIGRPTCGCVGADGKRAPIDAHPTVKPPGLIRSLVRHITPKGGTVLDPFAGTGTTGKAALDEGCKAVLIEMEAEYAADIRCRLGLIAPADNFDDLLGEPECDYCGNSGWFYGDADLGMPCGCPHGDRHAVPVHINSTDSGLFEELLG